MSQFASAQNTTLSNMIPQQAIGIQSTNYTEATTAIPQPSQVIVPPRVSIFSQWWNRLVKIARLN